MPRSSRLRTPSPITDLSSCPGGDSYDEDEDSEDWRCHDYDHMFLTRPRDLGYKVLPVGTAITPPGMFKRKMNAEVRRKREGVHAWELPAIERTKYSFEHLAPACQSWRIPDSVPESSTGIVVSAMESGPGPAKYTLPPVLGHCCHTATKQRNPAYSFGEKHPHHKDDTIGPGPGAYLPIDGVTRNGVDGTPQISLGKRMPLRRFDYYTPGPGDYENEKCHPHREPHAPKWTFRPKTKPLGKDECSPGPAAYGTLDLFGNYTPYKATGPMYSLHGVRDVNEMKQKGRVPHKKIKVPGPAEHNPVDPNNYKSCAPKYTLKGSAAARSIAVKNGVPAPNTYYPEMQVANIKEKAPSVSFGIKHSPYIKMFSGRHNLKMQPR